jgi:hypothetical protein
MRPPSLYDHAYKLDEVVNVEAELVIYPFHVK